MKRLMLSTLVIAAALPRPCWAQARVEVGGGLVGSVLPGFLLPSLNVRTHVTSRAGIDVAADFVPTNPGVTGAYRIQAFHAVRDRKARLSPFVTYGVAGSFEYRHLAEHRFTVQSTGDRVIYPAHWYGRVRTPVLATAGGGVRQRVAAHLFFEYGARAFVPVGAPLGPLRGMLLEVHAGIVVPIGSRR